MSINHKYLVCKRCKANLPNLINDHYKTVQHNRFDTTLAVNTKKITLIILLYVTLWVSKQYKTNSVTGQNSEWNPITMLCETGNNSKNMSEQLVLCSNNYINCVSIFLAIQYLNAKYTLIGL
jgi:hypothetical protein